MGFSAWHAWEKRCSQRSSPFSWVLVLCHQTYLKAQVVSPTEGCGNLPAFVLCVHVLPCPGQREPGHQWHFLLPGCCRKKGWMLPALKCVLRFLLSSRHVETWLTCGPAPSCSCLSVGLMATPTPMNACSVCSKCKLITLLETSRGLILDV